MQQGFWTVVLGFGAAILIMANGFAWMTGGAAAAGRLNRRVGRTLWRSFCRTVAWIFKTIADIFSGWGR